MRTRTMAAGLLALTLANAWAQPDPIGSAVESFCESAGGCTTCRSDLEQCESAFEACEATRGRLLATGQQTTYATGDDGDLSKGNALSYVDNGDGTITDANTGLMWEKKDRFGNRTTNLHHVDNIYPWSGTCTVGGASCGTDTDCPSGACDAGFAGHTILQWAEALNVERFAGHEDWRIPNKRELESIIDLGRYDPSVDPVFHHDCTPSCTVLECSCTSSSFYWSSTTVARFTHSAWYVEHQNGVVAYNNKPILYRVRAVRGGS